MTLEEFVDKNLSENKAMVFIVRHGETDFKGIKGQSDHSVNEKGSIQAEIAAETLEAIQPCKILSSDLDRAKETAKYFEGEIQTSKNLRERDFGDWKGERSEVFQQELKESDHDQIRPPDGENLAEIYDRVTEYLDESVEAGEKVICITHHGPVISLTGYGADNPDYECDNGSITAIEIYKDSDDFKYQVLESNIVPYEESHPE